MFYIKVNPNQQNNNYKSKSNYSTNDQIICLTDSRNHQAIIQDRNTLVEWNNFFTTFVNFIKSVNFN